MKHLFILILTLLVAVTNATERVNMTCKFDAIASGYVSKTYSVNLILEGNAAYNADGSHGNNRNAIFANGSTNYDSKYSDFSFRPYDGNEYRGLRSADGVISCLQKSMQNCINL